MSLPKLVLRTERMQPGDILLTRGAGAQSALIDFATRPTSPGIAGKPPGYSHAAIIISQSSTFESDGGIVGFRAIRGLGWIMLEGKDCYIAEIPGKPTFCRLYRHPLMGNVSPNLLRETFDSEIRNSWGKDYSEYHRLVRLAFPDVSTLGRTKNVVANAVALLEEWFIYDKLHGPFCSELIARIFSRLDLPLFNGTVAPDKVTPNALAQSNLSYLPDVVLDGSTVQGFRPEPDSGLIGLLDLLGEERGQQRRTTRAVEGVQQILDDLRKDSRHQLSLVLAYLEQQEPFVFRILSSAKNDAEVRRGRRLAIRYIDARSAVGQVALDNSSDAEEILTAFRKVRTFNCSLTRCLAIYASREFRGLRSVLKDDQAKITSARRKILLESREQIGEFQKNDLWFVSGLG
jgi:hypothetical protein